MQNNDLYAEQLAAVVDSREAGAILGVGSEMAKVLARRGQLAAKRLGRDWIFSKAACEELAKIDRPIGRPAPAKPDQNPKAKKQKRGKSR